MNTQKVLVASVFTNNEMSLKWASLQSYFLNKTINHTIHKIAILQPGTSEVHKNHYNVLGYETINCTGTSHGEGISSVLAYFREHSEYDYLCLLDSDAWPVDGNWISICRSRITERHIGAAAVRFENLDTFPHPCVFFINRKYLNNTQQYTNQSQYLNLLNKPVKDPFSDLKLEYFFPLIRSNKLNLHPVMAGMYYNIFYHHAAGSRNPGFRSMPYYSLYIRKFSTPGILTEELFKDPDSFINSLKF